MRWPAMVGIMANGEGSLLGGLCLQTWCAAGSFCLVSILSVVADTRCRRMGGEVLATSQIERLMTPTPRIIGQATRCKRSAWISLTKTDAPSCSLRTSSDWTMKLGKILFDSLKLQFFFMTV